MFGLAPLESLFDRGLKLPMDQPKGSLLAIEKDHTVYCTTSPAHLLYAPVPRLSVETLSIMSCYTASRDSDGTNRRQNFVKINALWIG